MKFKVYNENGMVRITKIVTSDEHEIEVFSSVANGEVAELTVEAHTSTNCIINRIGANTNENNS